MQKGSPKVTLTAPQTPSKTPSGGVRMAAIRRNSAQSSVLLALGYPPLGPHVGARGWLKTVFAERSSTCALIALVLKEGGAPLPTLESTRGTSSL